MTTTDDFAAAPSRMPVLYLSHGAPPLADDRTWTTELAAWSADLPTPESILMQMSMPTLDPRSPFEIGRAGDDNLTVIATPLQTEGWPVTSGEMTGHRSRT